VKHPGVLLALDARFLTIPQGPLCDGLPEQSLELSRPEADVT
jgi:hypothetical protein